MSEHTQPEALRLAEYRTRCRMSESCLPEADYRTRLTALHDEMMTEIEAAHAVGIRQEREIMALEAMISNGVVVLRESEAQRDELLAALEGLMSGIFDGPDESDAARLIANARAAIAKAGASK